MTVESDARKIWEFLDDFEGVGEIIYQVQDTGTRLTIKNGSEQEFTMEYKYD